MQNPQADELLAGFAIQDSVTQNEINNLIRLQQMATLPTPAQEYIV